MYTLTVKSKAFSEGGMIPVKHTGRGEDLSPALELEGIAPEAQSIAITLDDASHPIFPNYNHWLIWNIPIQTVIPEAIPHGNTVASLDGAIQGLAYGRHKYRGPKPPSNWRHNYIFTVYTLDCKLNLPVNTRKRELLSAMAGHILQQATLSGQFQSRS